RRALCGLLGSACGFLHRARRASFWLPSNEPENRSFPAVAMPLLPMPTLALAENAARANDMPKGPEHRQISGVAPLDRAGPEDLSFVANPRYLPYVQGTRAGVLLVPETLRERVPEGVATISVEDAHLALYHVLPLLRPTEAPAPGIHPTAV